MILIAEDDTNLGFLLKNELEDEGYSVDVVGDGVEAVLKYISMKYDFVIFDLKMPKLDGINALKIVKKLNPEVPALTMSGNAGTGEMAESVRAGAIRCLEKPFQVSELKEDIKKYFSEANCDQL